jgi:two-component system invasion response regulator UvrY
MLQRKRHMKAPLDTGAKMPKRRIMIIDDNRVLRLGLRRLIELEQDMEIVAELETAEQALELIDRQCPDIAVVDIAFRAGGMDGIALTRKLRERHPQLPVLIFTMHDTGISQRDAANAGARGFVTKYEGADRLLEGIREVLRGGTFALQASG